MFLKSLDSTIMKEQELFYNQWTCRPRRTPQEFHEPTCTVPNQSMTVAQIIAKYSRMGVIPAVKSTLEGGRYLQRLGQSWPGDNIATDPDFDPLDDGQEFLEDSAAARVAGFKGGSDNDLPNGGAGEAGVDQGADAGEGVTA